MAADKTLFAPVPLRAMADDLSGLEMRVLACVASHDRMSLISGKWQGCRASNERMSKMVGCSFARVCSTLSALTDRGYLERSKPGRNTVYQVLYTEADRLLFGNVSPATTGCRIGTLVNRIGSRIGMPSDGNETDNRSQYISLNEGIDSEESGKDSSPEGARLSGARLGKIKFEDNVGGQLARFERAYQESVATGRPIAEDCLVGWYDYLEKVCYDSDSADDPNHGRASRLMENIEWPVSVWERAA